MFREEKTGRLCILITLQLFNLPSLSISSSSSSSSSCSSCSFYFDFFFSSSCSLYFDSLFFFSLPLFNSRSCFFSLLLFSKIIDFNFYPLCVVFSKPINSRIHCLPSLPKPSSGLLLSKISFAMLESSREKKGHMFPSQRNLKSEKQEIRGLKRDVFFLSFFHFRFWFRLNSQTFFRNFQYRGCWTTEMF